MADPDTRDGVARDLVERASHALAVAGVEHADLYLTSRRRGMARFSNNSLDQHVDIEETAVTARAAVATGDGWSVASVTVSDVDQGAFVDAVRKAYELARRTPPTEGWPGFASPDDYCAPVDVPRYVPATAAFSAKDRAAELASAFGLAKGASARLAGLFETSDLAAAVVNTEGVVRHACTTLATCKFYALDAAGVSGFAQCTDRDVGALSVRTVAMQAIAKCLAAKDPVPIDGGEYDVVLEPTAVAELLEWLAMTAFSARAVQEGTSPLAGRVGEMITGPRVTLVDDATDPSSWGFGLPFDRDGVPRQRVVLVERGVARGPVYDLLHAARAGVRSTGHAAPPGSDVGDAPVASSVSMEGGDETLDTLMGRVDRGLYVTRFHYVNGLLEPRRAVMTGMTRDGTFLLEDGVRTRGVKNLRFTDSILEAFARIDGVGVRREAVTTWWSEAGAFVAPALLIRGLRFTSGSAPDPDV
jgi:predicted Zn-dependent protease